jgi:hypothetical protein
VSDDPADGADYLNNPDQAGERGAVMEFLHELSPRRGAFGPGLGVSSGANYCHDAVSDEGHGGEVFPAIGLQQHCLNLDWNFSYCYIWDAT